MHLNLQDVNLLEGVNLTMNEQWKEGPILKDYTRHTLEKDNSTHFIVFVLKGGGGRAHFGVLCSSWKPTRYSVNGCGGGINSFRGGVLGCAHVR